MAFLTGGDIDLLKFLLEMKYQPQQSTGELTDSFGTGSQTSQRGQIMNLGEIWWWGGMSKCRM